MGTDMDEESRVYTHDKDVQTQNLASLRLQGKYKNQDRRQDCFFEIMRLLRQQAERRVERIIK